MHFVTHPTFYMLFAAFVLQLVAPVHAQTRTIHVVTVGAGGGLVYSPPTVNASTGDVVTFMFQAAHTVTQSTFAAPCAPLANDTGHVVGFNSDVRTAGGTYSVIVTEGAPIWFYCGIPGHCQAGMVGSINPPATGNTYDNFVTNAKGAAGQTTTAASIQGVTATGVGASPTSVSGSAASTSTGSASSSAAPSASTTSAGSAPPSSSFEIGTVTSALVALVLVAAGFA